MQNPHKIVLNALHSYCNKSWLRAVNERHLQKIGPLNNVRMP